MKTHMGKKDLGKGHSPLPAPFYSNIEIVVYALNYIKIKNLGEMLAHLHFKG